ncbi:FecR family protein [Dongia rigui]|uniref:FecR family protein n=1 Tax=Dongia rigui TaxID=940149 RepID=A0ABU5DX41_9PROT|nr:FecR family protein [Dongia rigui]MDY0871881.1 FecR family protein [Dongia rigui]
MPATFSRQQFLHLGLAGMLAPLGFAAPGFFSPAFAAIAAVGSVAKVRGTASLLRDGQQIVLQGGEEVAAGDVVTTLAESRLRIALKDGSQLNLGELTKMTIAAFDFTPEDMKRAATFDLTSGLVQAITAKAAPGSSFVIRTRNAVAATRSTEWIVTAEKSQTGVYVTEGKVDVAQSALGFRSLSSAEQDKAMLLSAGQSTIVGKMTLGATLAPQPTDAKKLKALKAALAFD